MTNNPTIDGVSRELRELLERVVGKPTGKPNWDALDETRIAAAEELRALLDAPAVERQPEKCLTHRDEPCQCVPAEPSVARLREALFEMTDNFNIVTRQKMGFAKQNERLSMLMKEFCERVERGEVKSRTTYAKFKDALNLVIPEETAPPAPVAVVLPDRKTEYATETQGAYLRGCNACLDATAALNTIHVGELDPAQRLAMARGETK